MESQALRKLFFLAFFLGSYCASSQDLKPVTGLITAFKTIPVNNARITSTKTKVITYTDPSGMFTINCPVNDILIVYASGFKTKKIRVGERSVCNAVIDYINKSGSFSSAVSNGHIPASELRSAINDMEKGNLKDYSKYKSIFDLISSEIYNVRVNGTTIVNTKVRSFDLSPRVLLVVDDKIVTDISYINPDYVKSVEFIDDASATMYGSMGANGVIKITLK